MTDYGVTLPPRYKEVDFTVTLSPRYREVDFTITVPPWFSPPVSEESDD